MLILVSETYILEMGAHVSLKVATKGSFRVKKVQKLSTFKAYFLKYKRRSANKKSKVSLMNFALIYLVQQHIFWK